MCCVCGGPPETVCVLRPQLVTELLFGVRVIKFYTWEPHFAHKISDCRQRELSHLKTIKYLDAVCVYTWAALPVVVSILTFLTYVLLGHQLTATKVLRQQASRHQNCRIWRPFNLS